MWRETLVCGKCGVKCRKSNVGGLRKGVVWGKRWRGTYVLAGGVVWD